MRRKKLSTVVRYFVVKLTAEDQRLFSPLVILILSVMVRYYSSIEKELLARRIPLF